MCVVKAMKASSSIHPSLTGFPALLLDGKKCRHVPHAGAKSQVCGFRSCQGRLAREAQTGPASLCGLSSQKGAILYNGWFIAWASLCLAFFHFTFSVFVLLSRPSPHTYACPLPANRPWFGRYESDDVSTPTTRNKRIPSRKTIEGANRHPHKLRSSPIISPSYFVHITLSLSIRC